MTIDVRMRIMIGTFSQVSLSYNPMNADDSYKTQTAVIKDIKKVKSNGIINIRTYVQHYYQLCYI